jgi:hypothetical protein
MGSQKIYWLTEKQADVITQMTQSGQYASKLIPLGGDRVKLSSIKSIEFEDEDFEISPAYFKEAVKKEMNGALPEPKKRIEKQTKTYYEDGTEVKKPYIQLCKEGVPFIERDFSVIDKRYVTNPLTGREEIAYQLGAVIEERYIGFERYENYYAPVMKSVKRDGIEILV